MSMPNNLVLVRHGQSAGNIAIDMAKRGDLSAFTDAYTTTPGHQWRLSDLGRQQAAAIGAHIAATFTRFDRYYCSPFVRTVETAGHLALPDAQWRKNRAIRERDWGDIGCLPLSEFEARPEYEMNARMKRIDPLYWCPPGGESIAMVAEDRVRNVCSTLHRECSDLDIIMVTHGELMMAFRLVLERLDDAEFAALDRSPDGQIANCETLHFTRINPATGTQAPRLQWLRRTRPVCTNGEWQTHTGEWVNFAQRTYTNDELLTQVADIPQLVNVNGVT